MNNKLTEQERAVFEHGAMCYRRGYSIHANPYRNTDLRSDPLPNAHSLWDSGFTNAKEEALERSGVDAIS